MKRILSILLLFSAMALAAQEPLSGIYHPYPDAPGSLSKAPAGYKPFYLSHYGRHGSRHLTSESSIGPAINTLRAAKEAGILTENGSTLLCKVEELEEASRGLWGELSPLGAREHQAIAARMVKNFPEAFRDSVRASATIYNRCIVSMAASTGEIRSLSPKAKFSYSTGKRYQTVLAQKNRGKRKHPSGATLQREYMKQNIDPEPVMESLFTDKEKAWAIMDNFYDFVESSFLAWAIRDAVSLPPFDLRDVFGEETVKFLARSEDLRHYQNMSAPASSDSLVQDVIQRADKAIASGQPGADLRYGHDSCLMRFFVQTGFEGYPADLSPGEAALFDCSEKMPMGSNLQMVFYRSKKGPVLVRFLFNENEILLKDVPGGPFYRWEDVKKKWSEQ